jgi:hypothetical protein
VAARPRTARRKPRASARKAPRRTKSGGRGDFAQTIAKTAASLGTAEDALTAAVRAGIAHALREPGASAGALFETMAARTQTAVQAALSVGVDALSSARSITRGVLLGVSDAGAQGLVSANEVVQAATRASVAAGSEAAMAGWMALNGAVDAARAASSDTTAAARKAAEAFAGSAFAARQSVAGLAGRLTKASKAHPATPPAKAGRRKSLSRARKKPAHAPVGKRRAKPASV